VLPHKILLPNFEICMFNPQKLDGSKVIEVHSEDVLNILLFIFEGFWFIQSCRQR